MLYTPRFIPFLPSRVLEQDADYLLRLRTVTAALSAAVTGEQVAEVIVTEAAPLLGAQSGVACVLSGDRRSLTILPASGAAPTVQGAWTRFAADPKTPLADAVREQALVVLETAAECRALYPHLDAWGADASGALVAIAAMHQGRAIGAVGFVFGESRRFSESDRLFLLGLGAQCGAALARADALGWQPPASAQAGQEGGDNSALLLALRSSEERLSLVLAATGDGVWDWQPPTGAMFLSARWKEMLGMGESEMGDTFDAWALRVHPDDWPRVQAEFDAHLRGETSSYASEHRLRHEDGSYRWMLTRGLTLRGPDGSVVRMLGTSTDITARRAADEDLARTIQNLQAANARLEALATTDSLTGLKNERVFQDSLVNEFRRARRYQVPLSLVLLDVDYFKSYNDAHGHPAGSRALRRLAQILRRAARETDIVCRYGGEEFALLLPHTSAADAASLAERLRAGVESAPWKRRALTISLGVCTLGPDMADPLALLERADAALYEAKAQGRNRVVSGRADPVSVTLPLDFSA